MCVFTYERMCVYLLQNPGKLAQEIQSSSVELITGLVQLVPFANTAQLSQEAMEVRHPLFLSTLTHSVFYLASPMLTQFLLLALLISVETGTNT